MLRGFGFTLYHHCITFAYQNCVNVRIVSPPMGLNFRKCLVMTAMGKYHHITLLLSAGRPIIELSMVQQSHDSLISGSLT